jgi:hypothetical protein
MRLFRQWVRHALHFDRYVRGSHAHEGEDLILQRIFDWQRSGFYVDVGAHHPTRFSNTYLFYRLGWRGINIDAMPGSMAEFRRRRSRDINLEIPIFKERQRLSYFQFNEPALNGFSAELSMDRGELPDCRILSVMEMEGFPLSDVLAQYLPESCAEIDFLSVDVEGLDRDVLQSNDWGRFRPKIVLVELEDDVVENLADDPIVQYMHSQQYRLFAKTVRTVFFISDEYLAVRQGRESS